MAWPKTHPNYSPPRGVGKGPGWGGPARGSGGDGRLYGPLTKDIRDKAVAVRKDPIAMAERRKFKRSQEERIDQLIGNLGDLALNADRQETQVSATIAALNRLDGMPKQKTENLNIEMSFEEMVKASLKPKAE